MWGYGFLLAPLLRNDILNLEDSCHSETSPQTGRENPSPSASHYLSGLDYGNGDKVQYIYDDDNHLTRENNGSGTAVVQYAYDAWGKILSTTGSMASTLGQLNPLRYRGYVYDTETGLYYLQSRYYDPEIGRFINADTADLVTATPMGLTDKNLFAYCDNNPVVRVDYGGDVWETVFDVVSLGFSIYDVIKNPKEIGAWVGLVGDIIDLVPFVTGVGEVARASRIIQKAIDSFGNLSKASKYGIKEYNKLRKALQKTGLQAHHIIEKRLVKHLGIDVGKMLSVAVTAAEHQKFTNAWRKYFKYGMDYTKLTKKDILNAAKKIYKGYPALIDASKKILYK